MSSRTDDPGREMEFRAFSCSRGQATAESPRWRSNTQQGPRRRRHAAPTGDHSRSVAGSSWVRTYNVVTGIAQAQEIVSMNSRRVHFRPRIDTHDGKVSGAT